MVMNVSLFVAICTFDDATASGSDAHNNASGAAGNDTSSHKQQSHDSSRGLKIFKFDTDLNHNEYTSTFKENYVDLSYVSYSTYSFTYCFRFEILSMNYQCLFYEKLPDIKFNFPEPHLNYGFVHFRGRAVIFQLPRGLELLPRVWYHVCVSHQTKNKEQMAIKAYFDGINIIDTLVEVDTTQPITFGGTWRVGFCKEYLAHKHLSPLSTILRGALSDFNVWSKTLTDNEMIMFTKTCTRPGGGGVPAPDIINWETVAHTMGSNAVEETLPWVCSDHETATVVFDQNTLFDKAMLWCQHLGGFVPLPKTPNEVDTLSVLLGNAIRGTRSEGCEHFWMPVIQKQKTITNIGHGTTHKRKRSAAVIEYPIASSSDSNQSVIWTKYSSSRNSGVSFIPWDVGQPDGLHFQPCASLDLTTKKFHDKSCHHSDFCGVCQFKGPVHYYLRGLPEALKLDTEYVFVPHGEMVGMSSIIISGYVDQSIRLSVSSETWEITSRLHGRLANLKGFGSVSPLGRKTWIYEQNGKLMEKELKLTMVSCLNQIGIDQSKERIIF